MLATTIADGGFVGFCAAAFLFLGALYFLFGCITFLMGLPRRRP